jgi:hypothetical protein
MKLTFGSEFVYTWLQVEIEWTRMYYFFNDYFGVETFARKRAVA